MLFKLALRNVRRQISNYLIYFITVSLTIALMFSVNNLIFSEVIEFLKEMVADFIQPILLAVSVILCIVIAVVLGHATSFLVRRRKKEFGLYLTMGMTRSNILALFAGETAVTFLLSLGAGVLLGLVFYPGLMTIFSNLLRMEVSVTNYSLVGGLVTVVMVGGMFFISFVSSLSYLRFTAIANLLQGEKRVEKTVKIPFIILWGVVFFAAVVGLVCSVKFFFDWLISSDFFERIGELMVLIVLFIVSVILTPVAFFKTVISLCLHLKTLTPRGTFTFTVRQLSGRLNASSVMIGALTLLLTIAMLAPNVFFTQSTISEMNAMRRSSFSILGYHYFREDPDTGQLDENFSYEEGLEIIRQAASVKEAYEYTLYEKKSPIILDPEGWYAGKYGNSWQGEYFVRESDFQKLCSMLGYTMPALNGGYLMVNGSWDWMGKADSFSYAVDVAEEELTLGGETYACVGRLEAPYGMMSVGVVISQWKVMPDEAVNVYELDAESKNLAVTLHSERYDARALRTALWGLKFGKYVLREYDRLDDLSGVSIVLLGSLFVSVVFILLTMAMLALKMLSMLTEDRERYRTLWRLGASEGTLRKTLFAQMFCFYFLPFALPFILCTPLAFMMKKLFTEMLEINAGFILPQVMAFAGVIFALYALYFTATYLIAWRDVKKNVNSIG